MDYCDLNLSIVPTVSQISNIEKSRNNMGMILFLNKASWYYSDLSGYLVPIPVIGNPKTRNRSF